MKNIGLGTILFVVFLVLKLCGTIGWSWWWVTAPLWIPIGVSLFIIGITAIFYPSELKDALKNTRK